MVRKIFSPKPEKRRKQGVRLTPCFPFYRERGESITPSGHSLPQSKTDQSGILSDERVGSVRPFQSIYRQEKAPPLAGPRLLTASGGEGASIAF